MRIEIYPDYLEQFHCVAGACKHTCCAKWEIDIDEESLQKYERDGLKYIDKSGTPHFVLNEGRCPYLNYDNLCELILTRGEEYLCQICRDHPRYRNFWTDATEIGVGLSCEAAAKLILGREEPMRLLARDADTGAELTMDEVLQRLPGDEKELFLLREGLLKRAEQMEDPIQARLLEYFLYRQIPDALYDGMLSERIDFIVDAVNEISAAWSESEDQSPEALCEIARAFSEDVEYNPEGLKALLEQYSNRDE